MILHIISLGFSGLAPPLILLHQCECSRRAFRIPEPHENIAVLAVWSLDILITLALFSDRERHSWGAEWLNSQCSVWLSPCCLTMLNYDGNCSSHAQTTGKYTQCGSTYMNYSVVYVVLFPEAIMEIVFPPVEGMAWSGCFAGCRQV